MKNITNPTKISIIYQEKLNLLQNDFYIQNSQHAHFLFDNNLLTDMPAYIDLKSTDSTYLKCSRQTAVVLAGLTSPQDILGRLDSDLAWGKYDDEANYKDSYLQSDKHALDGNIVISIGQISYTTPSEHKIMIIKKYPLLNEGHHILGIVSYLIDITNNSLDNALTQIIALGISLTPSIIVEANKYMTNQHLQELSLSKREEECLYYLLRNNTAKDIAKILDLSHRTVESYLNNLKDKFNCINKTNLIIKAMELGAINLIPETILLKKYLSKVSENN